MYVLCWQVMPTRSAGSKGFNFHASKTICTLIFGFAQLPLETMHQNNILCTHLTGLHFVEYNVISITNLHKHTHPPSCVQLWHTLTSMGSMYCPEGMESKYFFRSMERNSNTKYSLDSCINTSSSLKREWGWEKKKNYIHAVITTVQCESRVREIRHKRYVMYYKTLKRQLSIIHHTFQ